MRSLVLILIPPDAQMFLSMTKAALALPKKHPASIIYIALVRTFIVNRYILKMKKKKNAIS